LAVDRPPPSLTAGGPLHGTIGTMVNPALNFEDFDDANYETAPHGADN